jgi:hypothetical protein
MMSQHDVLWNNPRSDLASGVEHHSFMSKAIGAKVGYCVGLPPKYQPGGKRLPLLLFLHGSGRSESSDAGPGGYFQTVLDNASRLTTLLYLDGSTLIATIIDSYDNVGNRTGRLRDGVTTTWSYDNDYRLLGQQVAGSYATFSYDANDNLLSKWHQGSNPITIAYDAANRPVTYAQGADLTTLTWAQRGVLNTSKTGTSTTTFTYEDITNRLFYLAPPTGNNSSYTCLGLGMTLGRTTALLRQRLFPSS